MAFSLFGKRAPDPETEQRNDVADRAASESQPAEKRGFFDRMKQAVARTRDSFSESIGSVLALTREVDETSLAELEAVLLAADIGSATAAVVIENLRQRGLRQGIETGEELKRLLKVELKAVLDGVATADRAVDAPPEVVMMVGVNGTGKTTTTGKLAAYFRGQGRTVLLCAADTFRAAAVEQLQIWAERNGVAMIRQSPGADPSAVVFDALNAAKARKVDYVIVDTAGRLHTKDNLMAELEKMRRTAQRVIPGAPHEVWLVMDATTGQNGLEQARKFTESAGVTGIVLTKLDGTAKGGIVVAIARELNLPIRFVGVGEKLDDLLPFEPEEFIQSLFEK